MTEIFETYSMTFSCIFVTESAYILKFFVQSGAEIFFVIHINGSPTIITRARRQSTHSIMRKTAAGRMVADMISGKP